ncbi:MAG: hypothetical protein K2P95_06750 [Hyphomonadaceae bacterium]|nr:hypothetical protein [Hyphomonadaceae bacterium]
MNWTDSDFAAFAAILALFGGAFVLLTRLRGGWFYRGAAALAAAGGFFMVWVALAVGAMGEPGDASDLLYLGVLLVGVIGAPRARGRPRGLAQTMAVMAASLAATALLALALGVHRLPNMSVAEVLGVNAMFALPFLVAAALFQRAAGRIASGADNAAGV